MIKESLTRRSGRRCRNLRLLTGRSDSGREKSKLKLTLIIKGLTQLMAAKAQVLEGALAS